jgi:hypothetical protein
VELAKATDGVLGWRWRIYIEMLAELADALVLEPDHEP